MVLAGMVGKLAVKGDCGGGGYYDEASSEGW